MNFNTATSDHEKIFVTQYTAVLMIILTFVVGAFSRPQQKVQPPVALHSGNGSLPAIEGPLPPALAKPIGTIVIANAFEQKSNNIDASQLEGVVAALRSHDIGVRFSITVAASQIEREPAEAALVARLVSSYRWLETLKLPRNAFEVDGMLVAETDAPELTVEFVGDIHE